jgi:hypothetical protein
MSFDAPLADPTGMPLDYPFALGQGSFRWTRQGVRPLGEVDPRDLARRSPILAVGSNGAPAQLQRKFAAPAFADSTVGDGVIPVTACVVADIDVVYAAFVAGYGSIPATSTASPGTAVDTFVTWLTPRQLDRMNQTEGVGANYRLDAVDQVVVDGIGPVEGVVGYVATAGPARVDGAPVALAAVTARHRRFPALGQAAVWARLAAHLGWAAATDAELSDLARATGADPKRRAQAGAALVAGIDCR